jgi:hypothetical protein
MFGVSHGGAVRALSWCCSGTAPVCRPGCKSVRARVRHELLVKADLDGLIFDHTRDTTRVDTSHAELTGVSDPDAGRDRRLGHKEITWGV